MSEDPARPAPGVPGPAATGGADGADGAALTGEQVRSWARTAVELLGRHRAELDALNVFPVADTDTGGNLVATADAAAAAVAATDPAAGVPALLRAWADGAARGAAGNSGFILSQIIRGLADVAAGSVAVDGAVDGAVVAAGLAAGALLGHGAVVEPVEGTILTVARAAADGARTAAALDPAVAGVVRAALAGAAGALADTPGQLEVLRTHGVVDAGGRGLVVVLAALTQVLTGEPAEIDGVATPDQASCRAGPAVAPADLRFEVQYQLAGADAAAAERLRAELRAVGDSVVVVPAGDGWKVHVHGEDVGAAIETGLRAGRPHAIEVTPLPVGPAPADGDRTVTVIAVAAAPGLGRLLAREGIEVSAGEGVAELVAAAVDADTPHVVLLPGALPAAVTDAVCRNLRDRRLRVAVVPTRSPVQMLAAVAVHDAARAFDDDVVAMAEAAAATRFAELVHADREALTAVGMCAPGDVLGLIDAEVVEIGRSVPAVSLAVLDRLLGVGGELITVLLGDGTGVAVGQLLERHVRERSPFTDVAVYDGGPADRPVVIGVE